MNKKVSIIVPVYNMEKYLHNCLNSIISQTYENLEIIVVNDGSKDRSKEIIEEFEKKDSRIIFIDKKENTGLADTRNVGLKRATGELLGFVDSDDYIEKDMYKILVEALEKYDADIALCDVEKTNVLNRKKTTLDLKYIEMTKKEALSQLIYDKNIANYVMVKLFKREIFENIQFPIGKLYEDIRIMYKLFNKANKFIYTPTKLYYYYQREDSIVHNETGETINQYLESIFNRYYDLKENYDIKEIEAYNVYSILDAVLRTYKVVTRTRRPKILRKRII